MNPKCRVFVILFALIAVCLPISVAQGRDKAERLLFNAKVFTGVPEHTYAEAVAIRGDKIVAVGNLPDVSQAVSAGAEKAVLQGKTLLPGLIDSHIHPIMAALRWSARMSTARFSPSTNWSTS